MFDRILVLCTGNVCRSPVAEALLKQRFPAKRVSSAGLGALIGEGVDARARVLAEAAGLEVGGHVARQVDEAMLREADLVLVMSERQRRSIAERHPSASGKTMLFARWLDETEIPDPYHKSERAFEHVHQLLIRAADSWIGKMPDR